MHDRAHWHRFGWAILVFAVVLAGGTIGFQALLGGGWTESFYRAVASTTLTGLDTASWSDAAKLFTVVLLFSGVAVFFYIAGVIEDVITRGVFGDVFEQRRRRRAIEELRDYPTICGSGRVGRSVAAELRATGIPYLVVDVSPESVEIVLDIAATAGGPAPELRFEEIQVTPECGPAGKTVGDRRIPDVAGAMIVALRKLAGSFEVTPGPHACSAMVRS